MLYKVAFSDEYFQGCQLEVHIDGSFASVDHFTQVLMGQALALAQEKLINTGFEGLVREWDQRHWFIHDLNIKHILSPPDIIWICSNPNCGIRNSQH